MSGPDVVDDTGRPSKPKAPSRDRTRAERMQATLEEMIVDGRLSPGEKLDELNLARRFEVSRTPVREAIRSLVATGLVEVDGRRGARVAKMSIPKLLEIFDHMAVLEGLCASYAARRASAGDLAQLKTLQEGISLAYEEKQPEQFYKLNTDFHDTIYAAARAPYLQSETIKLRRRLAPFRMQVTYQPGRMHATLAEHARIVSAIEAMDAAEAARAATDHVRLLGDDLTDFIAMMPPNLIDQN